MQNNEFVDHRTGRFFMRTELEGIFNDTTLLADLDSALPEGSVRELNPAGRRRIVILVTKEAHCTGDLLMKANYGGWTSKLPPSLATTRRCVRWLNVSTFRLNWSVTKAIPVKSTTT